MHHCQNEFFASVTVAFKGVGLVISGPFFGWLMSNTSTRFCFIVSTLLRTVSVTLLMFSKSEILWIISFFCYGCSSTGITSAENHFISVQIKSHNRGKMSSFMTAIRHLGGAIGSLFIVYINNLNELLLLTTTVSIMSIFVGLWLISPNTIENKQMMDIPLKNSNQFANTTCYVWKRYGKLLSFTGVFGFGLSWVRRARKLILTFHGVGIGLSKSDIGYLHSMHSFIGAIMFPIAGYLMDKFGRKSTTISGLLLFIIGFTFISVTNDFISLRHVAMIFAFAHGITGAIFNTWSADVAPFECKPQFITHFRTIINLASVLCPFVVGVLCTHFSLINAVICSGIIGCITLLWIMFILEDPIKYAQKQEKLMTQRMDIVHGVGASLKSDYDPCYKQI